MASEDPDEGLAEIAIVGDITENESDITERLLAIPPGGSCVLYFDSPGGSPYTAISLLTLIRARRVDAVGVVTGECSSSALWPLAGCRRRIVTPYSVLLFHPVKWQSEEHVLLPEAAEWARHFANLERGMDELLADLLSFPYDDLAKWVFPGRYVSGHEFAAAGLGELITFHDLPAVMQAHEEQWQRAKTAKSKKPGGRAKR